MKTKYIFVTGGVVSSLGKGITSASLGRLLKARGLKVSIQKFDPYLNYDPRMIDQRFSNDFYKLFHYHSPGLSNDIFFFQ